MCVLEHPVSSQNTCVFLVRTFSLFIEKAQIIKIKAVYVTMDSIAGTEFEIARADVDAHARMFTAAMRWVFCTTRGQHFQDDPARMG